MRVTKTHYIFIYAEKDYTIYSNILSMVYPIFKPHNLDFDFNISSINETHQENIHNVYFDISYISEDLQLISKINSHIEDVFRIDSLIKR